MPITMLDQVDFTKIAALNFVVPIVTSDPSPVAADEGRLIYNTTENALKYCNETPQWVTLGQAGAGVADTRAILAGAGLSGGGNLQADRTITFASSNADIQVNTDDVTIIAAPKWSTGRTITLSGDVGGTSPSWDGAGNLTFSGVTISNLAVTDAKVAAANKDGLAATASMRTLGTGAQQAAAGNDSRFTDSRAPNGSATGDLTGSYPNPQIAAGVIVDNDINASAAIATSKISGLDTALTARALTATDLTAGAGLTGGGTLAANRTFAVGAGTGITANADDVAINRTTVDAWYLGKSGGAASTMDASTDLTLARDPSSALHAATKQYVDLTAQGLTFKNAVRAVVTTQRALSALTATDGVTFVANDRVLLAGQTTPSENGIWLAQSGAWGRATDADASGEIKDGTIVPVAEGTAGADSLYICTATGATPWVPGTSSSTWTRFTSVTDLVAGAGLTKTGTTVDVVSANSDLTVGADSITIVSAPKWTTGRTITLTGDVTGVSGALDGSAALSFATAIGAGVIMDADVNGSAAIATSKINGLDTALTGKVPTTRSVLAGNGLTGGGTLASDVTLNVAGGATLSITADSVDVVSAPKWTTARSITLTGDVTGTTASVDGSANISIATTLAASRKMSQACAAATTTTVTHNWATRDVAVTVYRTTTPWDTVEATVTRPDTNSIVVTFGSAPSAGAFQIVVTG